MLRQPACLPCHTRHVAAAMLAIAASALTACGGLLYETGFETTDSPPFAIGVGTALVNTNGWSILVNPATISPSSCYAFAGIDALDSFLGQSAYLGYIGSSPPPSGTQFIRVGSKVSADPVVAGNTPVVDFYCVIGLTQATNSRHDDFELLVYNWDDKLLGGLTFDLTLNKLYRYDANEYSDGYIDGTSPSPYTDTRLSLSSIYGTEVEVTMRINYRTNTWTASVGGIQVVTDETFTNRPVTGTNGAARTYGSVQARWYISEVLYPGNNWMLFDDWSISAAVEPTIPAGISAGYAANSPATLAVTDAAAIGWSVSSDQPWAVVSPSSGSGSKTVTVMCAANPNPTARTATIKEGSQTCVLTQSAAPALTSIPSTASAACAANSTAAITVTASTTWNASSDRAWAVVSPASGTGNGTLTVTCALNATAATRSATITVGTQTCLLTQAASPYAVWASALTAGARGVAMDADHDGVSNGMEYALGRNAASSSGSDGISQLPVITASGSAASQHLTLTLSLPDPAPADLVYDVQVIDSLTGSWTNIMEKNGAGQWLALGNSGATMTSSADGSGRTSYIITDVQGYHFMRLAVTSSSVAAPVTSIPATASALYAAASTATIQVTSDTNWTASSDHAWAVVSPASGSGNGSVTVTCAANADLARTATISIGGQTCVVTQAGAPYALWAATLPAGQQGFYQDADGDGVGNGIEYALGRIATSAAGDNGPAQLPVLTWTGGGVPLSPALAINLPTTAPEDATYDVQVSNTLTDDWTAIIEKVGNNPWTVIGASGAGVSSASAGTGRTVYTVTDSQSHLFLRLVVTKTP